MLDRRNHDRTLSIVSAEKDQLIELADISTPPEDKFSGLDRSYTSLEAEMPRLIQTILDLQALRLEMSEAGSRVLVTQRGLKDGEVVTWCPSAFFSAPANIIPM